GFLVIPCINAPATLKAAPTMAGPIILGNLNSHIIWCWVSDSLKLNKAFHIVDKLISAAPREIEAANANKRKTSPPVIISVPRTGFAVFFTALTCSFSDRDELNLLMIIIPAA